MRIRLTNFTTTPGPRFRKEGAYSGQEWRDDYLLPAFEQARKEGSRLLVDLDGADGFASSFLEEAFGGLVRALELPPEDIAANLDLQCHDEPGIVEKIRDRYIRDARK